MLQDYKDQLKTYKVYQKIKIENAEKYGKLIPVESPKRVWQKIALELVTDLSKTKNQKDLILVIIDMLSKIIRLVTTKKELSSKELVQLFTNNVVALFSIPKEIVSDNDIRITAEA